VCSKESVSGCKGRVNDMDIVCGCCKGVVDCGRGRGEGGGEGGMGEL